MCFVNGVLVGYDVDIGDMIMIMAMDGGVSHEWWVLKYGWCMRSLYSHGEAVLGRKVEYDMIQYNTAKQAPQLSSFSTIYQSAPSTVSALSEKT